MKYFLSIISLALFSILVAFGVVQFFNYAYPMTYSQEIRSSAQEFGISPSFIASVAAAESGMKSQAVSSKGAVGVMQIMPSTAEWLCKNLGVSYSENRLFEPEYNIRLGSYYLSYLLNYFNEPNLAICAYNAGPNKVSSWLEKSEYSLDGEKLDKIPYPETEKYLKKVNKNRYYYEKRYK